MTDSVNVTIGGTVAPGFEGVRDAFAANFAPGFEVGASAAVYLHGRPVVDLWGGSFEQGSDRPYDDQTLQLVFSTTKGVAATAVAMCVARGLLSYDEKVSHYWPEFAANGKGDITVAQLLSHQAGLITIVPKLTFEQCLDRETVTAALAAMTPLWEPGTQHGYHAVTYGWLAAELVRRTDGRTMSQFVAEDISARLDLDLWIGLPASEEIRVSPIIAPVPSTDPAVLQMMEQFMGPQTFGGRALSVDGAFTATPDRNVFNERAVHEAEIPAANGITNARSLARLYAATFGEVDGVRLLPTEVMERARVTVTSGADACLIMPTTFGMGYMTHGTFTPMAGPGSYGHAGAGGSLAFAHPESGMSLAYVMNRMDANIVGDLRAANLIAAVQAAL